jgi:hypothetical protein
MIPAGLPSAGWGIDMDWAVASDEGFRKIAEARKGALQARIGALTNSVVPLTAAETQELADSQRTQAIDTSQTKGKLSGPITSVDPRYAQQRLSADMPRFSQYHSQQSNGNAFVWDGNGPFPADRFARLRDAPGTPTTTTMTGMQFEVAALLDRPGHASVWLGSVSWGWRRGPNPTAKPALDPFAIVNAVGISQTFLDAIQHWNVQTVADPTYAGGARPVMQL